MNFSAERTLGAGQAELSTQFPHLIRLKPGIGMKRFFENQLGRFGGNFFDVHAARAAGHQHRHRRRAIDDDSQVQLPGDVAAGFDQHAANCLAGRAGLNRDQFVAQQLAGHGGGFLGTSHELHAVLLRVVLDRALTAAAGVNLGFHHRNRPAQRAKRGRRLFRRARHDAIGQRDARLAQQLLPLILVDFHPATPVTQCIVKSNLATKSCRDCPPCHRSVQSESHCDWGLPRLEIQISINCGKRSSIARSSK